MTACSSRSALGEERGLFSSFLFKGCTRICVCKNTKRHYNTATYLNWRVDVDECCTCSCSGEAWRALNGCSEGETRRGEMGRWAAAH